MYELKNLNVDIRYLQNKKMFVIGINVFGGLTYKECVMFAALDERVNISDENFDLTYFFKQDAFMEIISMDEFLEKIVINLNLVQEFIDGEYDTFELYVKYRQLELQTDDLIKRIEQLENTTYYNPWWTSGTITLDSGCPTISDNTKICNIPGCDISATYKSYSINGEQHSTGEMYIDGALSAINTDGKWVLSDTANNGKHIAESLQKSADEITSAKYGESSCVHDENPTGYLHTSSVGTDTVAPQDK